LSEQHTPPRFTMDGEGAQMTFFEHLAELRNRALWSFLWVGLGTSIGAVFAGQILRYLGEPYLRLSEESKFLITDPTGSVVAYFRVALLIGSTLAVPFVTYQIVMYILPAMTRRERRLFVLGLPPVFGLFLVGIAFAWYILVPPALSFLEGFLPDLFRTEWEAGRYITFVTSLLFWMGVSFETPLVLFVLSLLGLVSPKPLIRNWRLAVVLSAAAAALITPTVDPVNMFLVMAPLMMLYLISIGLVAIGIRISRRSS